VRIPTLGANGRAHYYEPAAALLYAAGISLVRSAGNDNGNFRRPTLDELLATIEAFIDDGMARGRWVGPRPAILFPRRPGAGTTTRITVAEYRSMLRASGRTLGPNAVETKYPNARVDEFIEGDGY